MADDTADAQTNGIANYATGKLVGGGAVVNVSCGFVPRTVRLINATDRIMDEKFQQMGPTEVIHTVAAGTRTLNTGSLLKFSDPETDGFRGFIIAAAAAIDTKELYWEAIG